MTAAGGFCGLMSESVHQNRELNITVMKKGRLIFHSGKIIHADVNCMLYSHRFARH